MTKIVRIKRIYDEPEAADGWRVLVDRLWPRGVSKEEAALDDWLKDIAPSTELREWFGHDPEKFAEFRAKYEHELANNPVVETILQHAKKQTVTLLYGAKDPKVNHAVVLQNYLEDQLN
jgi:uncharacterized protein YeaO (DUF488 family)